MMGCFTSQASELLPGSTGFNRWMNAVFRRVYTALHLQERAQPTTYIRRVTVAGTTGAIGAAIISALVKADFEVQALTRSTSTLPLPVRVRSVDYTNEEQLIAALNGQDAVISCLGDTASAVSAQRALIEASIKAGVKRFLPSEYGSDTSRAYVRSLPFFQDKVEHQKKLKSAALHCPDFSYTILSTGLFLDWCLSTVPCIINCGSRSADVYDDGNVQFSVTRTITVAEAITRILQQPEQTRNKTLRVHEMVLTQNELIQRAESLTTTLPPFCRRSVDTAAYEAQAWRAYADPGAEPLEWLVPFINLSVWSRSQPGRFENVDNALLGIEVLGGVRRAHVIEEELYRATRRLYSESGDAGEQAYEDGKQKLVDG